MAFKDAWKKLKNDGASSSCNEFVRKLLSSCGPVHWNIHSASRVNYVLRNPSVLNLCVISPVGRDCRSRHDVFHHFTVTYWTVCDNFDLFKNSHSIAVLIRLKAFGFNSVHHRDGDLLFLLKLWFSKPSLFALSRYPPSIPSFDTFGLLWNVEVFKFKINFVMRSRSCVWGLGIVHHMKIAWP